MTFPVPHHTVVVAGGVLGADVGVTGVVVALTAGVVTGAAGVVVAGWLATAAGRLVEVAAGAEVLTAEPQAARLIMPIPVMAIMRIFM